MTPRYLYRSQEITARSCRVPLVTGPPVRWRAKRDYLLECVLHSVLAATAVFAFTGVVRAADIGTAFTYQGSLEKPAGSPVTGTCDFRFGLWNAAAGGNQVGSSPQTVSPVDVAGGVFTVTLDNKRRPFDAKPCRLARL